MKNILFIIYITIFTSCNSENKLNCDFLENAHVKNEIQKYIIRNGKNMKGIYYVSHEKLNNSHTLEMSSMVFKSQFDDFYPCNLSEIDGNYILIKCGNCNNSAEIYEKIKSKLLVENKEIIDIQANGDTIIHHIDLLYNPEVLTIEY